MFVEFYPRKMFKTYYGFLVLFIFFSFFFSLANKSLRWYGHLHIMMHLLIEINSKITDNLIKDFFSKIDTVTYNSVAQWVGGMFKNVSPKFESRWCFYDFYLSKKFWNSFFGQIHVHLTLKVLIFFLILKINTLST